MNVEDSPPEGFIPAEKDASPVRRPCLPWPRALRLADHALNVLSRQSNQNLEPDMINGWRPKFRITGPVPLRFGSAVMDSLVQFLLGRSTPSEVVYIGPRPANSMQFHRELIGRDAAYLPSKEI
jgi:hypothetical protein